MPFFTNCAMIIPHCQYEGKPQDLSLLAPTKRILISLRTFASSVDQDIRRNTRRTKNKRPSAKATPLRNGLSSIDECRGAHASTLDSVQLHVVRRGHNREPCFFAEEDYNSYLHW